MAARKYLMTCPLCWKDHKVYLKEEPDTPFMVCEDCADKDEESE